jgi:ribosomal protein S18 acetylase RimI-like enzyme
MGITYTYSLDGITASKLAGGFFEGWPNPPVPETHLRMLHGSSHVVLALDDGTGQVIGYINAVSDGLHSAFIPQLEVLPAYRERGIGGELVRRMLEQLRGYYSIDLICDEDVQPFYERLGMRRATGMLYRNYDRQAGAP